MCITAIYGGGVWRNVMESWYGIRRLKVFCQLVLLKKANGLCEE
jgi:hypothetical protein